MANVECASVTVGRQNPQTSHGRPPIRNIATASSSGGTKKYVLRKRISQNFEKSRITGLVGSSVSFFASLRNQPTCA